MSTLVRPWVVTTVVGGAYTSGYAVLVHAVTEEEAAQLGHDVLMEEFADQLICSGCERILQEDLLVLDASAGVRYRRGESYARLRSGVDDS